jgi:hypothetical protein
MSYVWWNWQEAVALLAHLPYLWRNWGNSKEVMSFLGVERLGKSRSPRRKVKRPSAIRRSDPGRFFINKIFQNVGRLCWTAGKDYKTRRL